MTKNQQKKHGLQMREVSLLLDTGTVRSKATQKGQMQKRGTGQEEDSQNEDLNTAMTNRK